MFKHFSRSLPVALAGLLTAAAQAQELRLFEPTEGEPAAAVPAGPEQPFAPVGNGQPAYTLRSVSHFGDQYQAVLVDRSGQTVKVAWKEGESAPVPNSAFTIVSSGSSSTVSLNHPAGDTCVNSIPLGVRCLDGNRSQLSLAVAAPLASNSQMPAMPQGAQGFVDNGNGVMTMGPNAPAGFFNEGSVGALPPGVDPAQNGQQVFINPFSGEPEVMPQVPPEELAARQQRQELRAARLRQFEQQQRIEDADIPAGMQRIRTPFGDRLMPIRE
jgi:hypothetical protein